VNVKRGQQRAARPERVVNLDLSHRPLRTARQSCPLFAILLFVTGMVMSSFGSPNRPRS